MNGKKQTPDDQDKPIIAVCGSRTVATLVVYNVLCVAKEPLRLYETPQDTKTVISTISCAVSNA